MSARSPPATPKPLKRAGMESGPLRTIAHRRELAGIILRPPWALAADGEADAQAEIGVGGSEDDPEEHAGHRGAQRELGEVAVIVRAGEAISSG